MSQSTNVDVYVYDIVFLTVKYNTIQLEMFYSSWCLELVLALSKQKKLITFKPFNPGSFPLD